MSVKGWIAWNFLADKVNLNLFQTFITATNNYYIELTKGNIQETNDLIWQHGAKMAANLLTNYTKNAKQKFEFYKYADTLNLVYKFNIGKTFTNIYVIPEEKKIIYEDKDCPICKNVKLPRKLKGIMYCNFIAGIFTELTKQGGYNTTCKEVKCKASGDDTCTYELTLTE